jgi:hypothetical protein
MKENLRERGAGVEHEYIDNNKQHAALSLKLHGKRHGHLPSHRELWIDLRL